MWSREAALSSGVRKWAWGRSFSQVLHAPPAVSTTRYEQSGGATGGYVFTLHPLWLCPLSSQESVPDCEDLLAHPEALRRRTDPFFVKASWGDILFVTDSTSWYAVSPRRFPGRWKQMPPVSSGPGPGPFSLVSAGRLAEDDELLILATPGGLCTGCCCLYSTHTHSWSYSSRPANLSPSYSNENSAWFRGSFYARYNVVREWWEMGPPDEDTDSDADYLRDSDEEVEERLYSIMRFDVGSERQCWEPLQLSGGDTELLNTGVFFLLVLRGRLLVFLSLWGYFQAHVGSFDDMYSGGKKRSCAWDGISNPFRVFSLEEEGDDPKRMKLVEVTGEFGGTLTLAFERNAARFFTGTGGNAEVDDDTLYWVSFDGEVSSYSAGNQRALLDPPVRFIPSTRLKQIGPGRPEFHSMPMMPLSSSCSSVAGGSAFLKYFGDLPEINDSTPLILQRPVESENAPRLCHP